MEGSVSMSVVTIMETLWCFKMQISKAAAAGIYISLPSLTDGSF